MIFEFFFIKARSRYKFSKVDEAENVTNDTNGQWRSGRDAKLSRSQ
jgi:hypothetical protein